jgi:hypothetical protein
MDQEHAGYAAGASQCVLRWQLVIVVATCHAEMPGRGSCVSRACV